MTLESARLEKSQKRPRTHPVTPVPCDADEVSYDAISPRHRLVTRASCDANDPSHDARASSAPRVRPPYDAHDASHDARASAPSYDTGII